MLVPAKCTPFLQPLDTCVLAVLRKTMAECWVTAKGELLNGNMTTLEWLRVTEESVRRTISDRDWSHAFFANRPFRAAAVLVQTPSSPIELGGRQDSSHCLAHLTPSSCIVSPREICECCFVAAWIGSLYRPNHAGLGLRKGAPFPA